MFKIIKFLIKLTDSLTIFLKVKKNRVLLISNYSKALTDNFEILNNELSEYFDVKVLLHEYNNSFIGKIRYVFFCLKQVCYINTSKIILTDTFSMSVSLMKKKEEVKVIQLWHASGAFKKFGHDVPNRLYELNNTDYCIITSKNVVDIYANALNIKSENVLPFGNPRTDCLFDKEYVEKTNKGLRQKYGFSLNDTVVTYAPTLMQRRDKKDYLDFEKLIKELNNEKFKFVQKIHPREETINVNGAIDLQNEKISNILIMTDILITDYSSIIFEFLINKSKLYFFVPDFAKFDEKTGFYIDKNDFEQLGEVCENYTDLKSKIEEFKSYDVNNQWVKEFYFDDNDGKSTQRLINFLKYISKGEIYE